MTPAGVWVVVTKAHWPSPRRFPAALGQAANNVRRVRRHLKTPLPVRAALVIAERADGPFERDHDWEGEPVKVFDAMTFWRVLREERRAATRRPVGPVEMHACAGCCSHVMRAPTPRCIRTSVCAMTLTRSREDVSPTHRPSYRAVLGTPFTIAPFLRRLPPRTASPALSPCGAVVRCVRTMRPLPSRRGKPDRGEHEEGRSRSMKRCHRSA